MTLSETKALIRHARGLMRECRAMVNTAKSEPEEIVLSRPDFEALEWGMAHLIKDWVSDFTDDGDPIPGSEQYVRLNCLFVNTGDPFAFRFKGIPVRMAT